MLKRWIGWTNRRGPLLIDAGLLLLRVLAGAGMALGHGWGKLANFADKADRFPDPLGLGSPTLSLALAVSAEFFCALLVVIGLATRPAAFGVVFTMAVAAFVIHGGDPFAKKELALLYLAVFGTVLVAGPGRWSVDGLLRRRLVG